MKAFLDLVWSAWVYYFFIPLSQPSGDTALTLILYRPSYRRDYPSQYSGGGEGDYSIRGFLSRPDDQLHDGRSYYSRQFGFQRSYDRLYGRAEGGTCPYQNQKLSRKRREAGEAAEDSEDRALKTRLRN